MIRIVLMAETGADIPPELVNRYGIHIAPMRVSFGDVRRNDGTSPSKEIRPRKTGRKKTSFG